MLNLPLSNNAADLDLRDALNMIKKELLLSINCHHIGTIQSFNSSTQTASASINYQKVFYVLDTKTNLPAQKLVPYPVNVDCPVIFLGGGNSALTFPIEQGDECLLLFNDRDMNNWFGGQNTLGPLTPRLHSFSDGIILVGLRSFSKKLNNFDTSRTCLRGNADGTTIVGVGESLIKIANAVTTLGTIFTTLTTDLATLATDLQGNPVVETAAFAAGSALQASLPALNLLISELLE